MITNSSSRVWCSSNYSPENEAFYVSNTKSLIVEQWTISWKHALVTTIGAIVAAAIGLISHPLAWIAAMQIGFVFFGILTYCHNDAGNGELAYLCCLIYFINKFGGVSSFGSTLFHLVGFALLFASVIPNILYRKVAGEYGRAPEGHWQTEEEEFEAWKRKYYNSSYDNYRDTSYSGSSYDNSYSYENTYNQNQTQNNSYQKTVDPNVEKARELFKDFGSTYQELKKVYRKLAQQYHPDHGGDNDLFAAIVNEYEYLKKTQFPGQK